jgi:hypothetical protein
MSNDKRTIFDTGSTGSLSGSSTEHSSYPSPSIQARDATTQTDQPFTYREPRKSESDEKYPANTKRDSTVDREKSTGTSFIVHKNMETSSPSTSGISGSSSSGSSPISDGIISEGGNVETTSTTGNNIRVDETKPKTILETPRNPVKAVIDRPKPISEGIRSDNPWSGDWAGGNSGDPGYWGNIKECTALTKTLVNNIVVNYADSCWCENCQQVVKVYRF